MHGNYRDKKSHVRKIFIMLLLKGDMWHIFLAWLFQIKMNLVAGKLWSVLVFLFVIMSNNLS
ncbi:MAG: hypothetical protein EBT92_03400 [Planctomycetes bacterium]|nr:hypothetical protein [Planctomycetota bacterium]NBY02267.1 hypothetical protein [Planctomycetota bacterium]